MKKELIFKIEKIFILGFLSLQFIAPAYAAIDLTENLSDAPGADLTIQKVLAILEGLACWISKTAIVIILCGIIVYAFLYFKSRGNPSELNTANQALKWGLIGALVIFSVYTIIRSVASVLGVPEADLGKFLSFSLSCS